MGKTTELRKTIKSLLINKCSNVHYRHASNKTPYPYIVYEIRDIGDTKVLEVNYWDRSDDTSGIEDIVDSVESLLDQTELSNSNHTVYFESNADRRWIDDEDKSILRINESFEIRFYGRDSR